MKTPSIARTWASRIVACDESPAAKYVCVGLLAVFGWLAIGPLIDSYNRYCFEADAGYTVNLVMAERAFVRTGNFSALPTPGNYPPYLDTQFWAYTATSYVVQFAAKLGILHRRNFPDEQSLAIASIRYCSALCNGLMALPIFLVTWKLGRSALVALGVGLMCALNSQIVDIDLLRVDRVVFLLLTSLIWLSYELLEQPSKAKLSAAAVTAAALATTKLSAWSFLIFPALPVAWLLWRKRLSGRSLWLPSCLFLGSVLLLSIRYVLAGQGAWASLTGNLQELAKWQGVLGTKPRFYYNWDAFSGDGREFIFLALAGVIGCAVVWAHKRGIWPAMIIAWFVLFSVLGYFSYKYSRGGYHLVPISLLAIATLAGWLRQLRPQPAWRITITLGIIGAFVPVLRAQTAFYRQIKAVFAASTEATRIIRIEPREWLQAHLPAGARVTIPINSEWAMPPIFDLGYSIGYRFLDFPYKDREATGRYLPPDINRLSDQTDVIILNDFHVINLVDTIRNYGYAKLADQWERFFSDLPAHYRVIDFRSPTTSYGVGFIRIVVVTPQSLKAAPVR